MQTFADNPIKASEKEIDGMKNVGLLSLINVNIFTIKKRKFFHKIFQELSQRQYDEVWYKYETIQNKRKLLEIFQFYLLAYNQETIKIRELKLKNNKIFIRINDLSKKINQLKSQKKHEVLDLLDFRFQKTKSQIKKVLGHLKQKGEENMNEKQLKFYATYQQKRTNDEENNNEKDEKFVKIKGSLQTIVFENEQKKRESSVLHFITPPSYQKGIKSIMKEDKEFIEPISKRNLFSKIQSQKLEIQCTEKKEKVKEEKGKNKKEEFKKDNKKEQEQEFIDIKDAYFLSRKVEHKYKTNS